jgi:hypothetical protein
VVPADHKWFARVVIGSAIVSTPEILGFVAFNEGNNRE